jgi:SAM-dependent methyltransferase
MLKRLHEKLSSAQVTQADATLLPFPTAHFDFVMTVHVLHLIAPWREALREFKRVLVPGGTYLNVVTWGNVGVSFRSRVREFWRGWLQERGIDPRLPGVRDDEGFKTELEHLGAHLTEAEIVRYPLNFTLRQELDRLGSRVYSDTWEIPDPIFEDSMRETWGWAWQEFGDLDQERADEVQFSIDIARFEAKR